MYYEATPWGDKLDGGILNEAKIPDNPDGTVVFASLKGWSAFAFWDRSGDRRGASNSMFMAETDLPPDRLVELARAQWPGL